MLHFVRCLLLLALLLLALVMRQCTTLLVLRLRGSIVSDATLVKGCAGKMCACEA